MLRRILSRRLVRAALFMFTALAIPAAASAAARVCSAPLTGSIPDRARKAPTGSKVMEQLLNTSGVERDEAVMRQVLSGNMPAFLRHLVPVSIAGTLAGGKAVLVTICVTPGYLAVGNNRDFVRVPMGLVSTI